MAEIIRINENTWRIEDGGVRFFVLEGKNEALMIDSGMNTPDAGSIAAGITALPLKLINTHADPDHISGNGAFDEFYMHPLDIEKYRRFAGESGNPVPVHGGDIIDLGGRTLTVIELHGHTPGSIALLDNEARVLFGGDSIQDGRIFMFGDGRNFDSYIESLESLWADFGGKFDTVYPSHASIPVEPELIPKLIGAAKEIRDGKAAGHCVDFMGKPVRACDFGFAVFLCDPE